MSLVSAVTHYKLAYRLLIDSPLGNKLFLWLITELVYCNDHVLCIFECICNYLHIDYAGGCNL